MLQYRYIKQHLPHLLMFYNKKMKHFSFPQSFYNFNKTLVSIKIQCSRKSMYIYKSMNNTSE